MSKKRAADDARQELVLAALKRLHEEGCPGVPEDPANQADMASRLIRRFDSVDRRHRKVDDRTRFLDLVRFVGWLDADCVAERTMEALGHPVPGMVHHALD